MNDIMNARKFGLVGTILSMLGFIPYLGILLLIVGTVLLSISMYKFSKLYNNKDIFKKFLTAWIVQFVGIFIMIVAFIFIVLLSGLVNNDDDLSIALFVSAALAFYAVFVFSADLYRKSFNLLGGYTRESLFNVAGSWIFWGYLTIILFGLGVIVIFVGWIILATAFYSVQETKGTQSLQTANNT